MHTLFNAAAAVLRHLEGTFAGAFRRPRDARVAACLFAGSVALSCAGVVGLVALALPRPTIGVEELTGRAFAAEWTRPTRVEAASTAPAPAARTGAQGTTTTTSPVAAQATSAPDEGATTDAPANRVLDGGRGGLPIGKGMWIWMPERAENGDANAVVERARLWGFTHLYVRTATYKEGFVAGRYLDKLLPVAHANGIRVYGWDFPYMSRPGDDVNRALAAITYTTPDGHRIDGFAPDIETKFEGVNENPEYVGAYVNWLRQNVGNDYPLIAVVPNPTPGRVARGYPYPTIVAPFDAVAPMVYWMDRDPGAEVAQAISYLSQFGKPVFPIGQAYDGGIDGGPAGPPNRDSLIRFMQVAEQSGADAVSFWSWQHATQEAWDAVGDAMEFRLGHGGPDELRAPMVRAYQLELDRLGFPVARTGQWDLATITAVSAFQRARALPVTGLIDLPTRNALLAPVAARVRPYGL